MKTEKRVGKIVIAKMFPDLMEMIKPQIQKLS